MHFSQFLRHIDQGNFAPVYLFTGEADLLMEEAWGQLLEGIVPPNARHFNGERVSAKECPPQDVLVRVSTLTMFGKKRLLMVQNVDAWPKDHRKFIMAYVKRPSPAACLVMTKPQRKGWEELASAVDAVGIVVHFPAPTEREAPRWLQERAKKLKKILSPQAASFLVEHVGTDLHLLDQELEKLASYTGERDKIGLDDAKQVVSWQRVFTVFELLDTISKSQPGQAVASLRKLLLAGEHPLGILALLARQVRILWQIKDGLERGLTGSSLSAQVRLPSSVLTKYKTQASQFTQEELYQFHRAIRGVDLMLKTSGVSAEYILESLIFNLSQSK